MKKTEAKAIETAKHMIGLDYKKPYTRHGRHFYRPYRNYFAAGPAGEPELDWLVSMGHAMDHRDKHRTMYKLTRAGLDWLGEHLGITIYDEEG